MILVFTSSQGNDKTMFTRHTPVIAGAKLALTTANSVALGVR
jgi:hypothetical protein